MRPGWWRRARLALLTLAVVLGGCGREEPVVPAAGLPPGEDVRVREVVDGDTVVVDGGRTVRLLGVDSPETVHPDRGVECYGPEAAEYLAGLVPPGTAVRLVTGAEPLDRYGRVLAWLHRAADGLFVNAALVRDGYARPLAIPPNGRFATEVEALAAQARAAGSGMWGACEDARGEERVAGDGTGPDILRRPAVQGALGGPPTTESAQPDSKAVATRTSFHYHPGQCASGRGVRVPSRAPPSAASDRIRSLSIRVRPLIPRVTPPRPNRYPRGFFLQARAYAAPLTASLRG